MNSVIIYFFYKIYFCGVCFVVASEGAASTRRWVGVCIEGTAAAPSASRTRPRAYLPITLYLLRPRCTDVPILIFVTSNTEWDFTCAYNKLHIARRAGHFKTRNKILYTNSKLLICIKKVEKYFLYTGIM